jgi:hypothetical protein|tara:strand:- start:903 stop:1331 length:429 start_codon:yes stop_codon:yes gene_type:complete
MNKKYYTTSFKQELALREKPIHTVQLQIDSLKVFMSALGYVIANVEHFKIAGLSGFEYIGNHDIHFPQFISFQDAQRLHNGVMYRQVGNDFIDVLDFKFKLHIPYHVWSKALRSKLVEQVKLQKLKKAPYVKVQSHYVKLVD